MEADYRLVSVWRVPVAPDACWAQMKRTLQERGEIPWWPGVSVPEPVARLAAGERFALAVHSPLGHRLRVRLTLTEVAKRRGRVAAAAEGDLLGTGTMVLEKDAEGAVITFRWHVSPTRRWMRATAPLLKPAFTRAHAAVMREGERGLRVHLAAPRGR
ncbi:MAG: hypothetical protein QM602_11540 [Microbacterium sp.]